MYELMLIIATIPATEIDIRARVVNICIRMDTQNDSGHFRFGSCARWADGDGCDGA